MRRHAWGLLAKTAMAVLCVALPMSAWSADRVRFIVAGTERSTNAQIVRDLGKLIAKPVGIDFDLRYSSGSPSTLRRLREGGGMQFALLQADVAQAYNSAVGRGNVLASELLAPVRVIAPLHQEEIFFIVRSDSPLNFVHEIENSRIDLGPQQGGTALGVMTLFRLMFGSSLPEAQMSFNSHQDALVKLTERSVDVVALVAPAPARLLADMKPEARQFVKLLKFDAKHPSAGSLLKTYLASNVPAASYPNLLSEDLPALAVRVYLVSHGRNDAIQARFAKAWCENLPGLRADGHPALSGLEPSLPQLVSGWQYSKAFEQPFLACLEGKSVPLESCRQEDRALGLCENP